MKKTDWNLLQKACSAGSALILTVVLTSMLAIVGVLFVMMARVDKVATSAISENRELDLAVETVIAKISQELVLDVPGVIRWQEYYDYPDANNAWLANLEPYESGGNYYWRQISDITGYLGPLSRDLPAVVVADHVKIDPCDLRADADGDGVSDSVWIKLPDMTSSKGKPIYTAIRVVDNEAMLNVNAGFKFDPNVMDANLIDGSSQTQINFVALAGRPPNDIPTSTEEADLLAKRANGVSVDPLNLVELKKHLNEYEQNVIWRYVQPNGPYTPFDISDELEMRYRYLLNHTGIDTRLEGWGGEFRTSTFSTPVLSGKLGEWFISAYDAGFFDPNYAYRHIATTYNMDRIIDPNGDRMINVNTETSPFKIYERLMGSIRSIYPVIADPNIAQLAVNMVDFADEDDINDDGILDINCVTTFFDASTGIIHYGFEAQPFITEIAWKINPSPESGLNYYALELYNPFNKVIDLNDFALEFVNRNDTAERYYIMFPQNLDGTPIVFINPNSYCVIVNEAGRFSIYSSVDPNTATTIRVEPRLRFFEDWMSFDKSKPPVDRRTDPDKSKPPIPEGWGKSYDVFLQRRVFVPALAALQWIYVDNQAIEPNLVDLALPGSALAFGRDDRDWRVVYQTLVEDIAYGGSLGMANYFHIPAASFPAHLFSFFLPNPIYPHARFITVGDIPRILTLGHGVTRNSTIGRQLMNFELLELSTAVDQEHRVRLDLRNPLHRNVFQYLTVFDPNSDNIDNDADGLIDAADIRSPEVQIPGRININTAPWYVIAQLPWVSRRINQPLNYSLAQAIVAYRDKLAIPPVDYSGLTGRFNATGIVGVREQPGFASTGELNFVVNNTGINNFNIGQYALDGAGVDLPGFPDLTIDGPGLGDGIDNDFEERDVIFSRISNLVTVRSDVFTAYILVRIGADGPQKRAIAILDRSGVGKTNVSLPDGKVRIVALHYVPDPR